MDSRGQIWRTDEREDGRMSSQKLHETIRYFFENQVIPTGLHDVSKSFRPNLATTRVFLLGTKFIPRQKA